MKIKSEKEYKLLLDIVEKLIDFNPQNKTVSHSILNQITNYIIRYESKYRKQL